MEPVQDPCKRIMPADITQHVDAVIQAAMIADYRFHRTAPNEPALKAIQGLYPNDQVGVVLGLLLRLKVTPGAGGHFIDVKLGNAYGHHLRPILSVLLRRELPFDLDSLTALLTSIRYFDNHYSHQYVPVQAILRCVARYIEKNGLPDALRKDLLDMCVQLKRGHYKPNWGARDIYAPTSDESKAVSTIEALLGPRQVSIDIAELLTSQEPWAAVARKDIEALPPALRVRCDALLLHLRNASGSKPTQKWLKEASVLVDSFGLTTFRNYLTTWLPLVHLSREDLPAPVSIQVTEDLVHTPVDQNRLITANNQIILKGLAWSASQFSDPEVAAALGDLGETCWKKIKDHGPRSKLVGNAVLWSLSAIGTDHAIAQLTRINSKLKHASARKLADKAMNRIAESTGQSREDLEELAVPTFKMNTDGSIANNIAEFSCSLSITPQFTAEITITDAAGKARKSIPAVLTLNPDFKALKRTLKELNDLLPSQRLRIESLLRLPERSWTFRDWNARYVLHPLLRQIAHRLIWQFTTDGESSSAMLLNGVLTGAHNVAIPAATAQTRVQLWHPCTASPEEVRAWRTFLETHRITQPFKQAHREVYLLTDAERRTETYSNRFAAHIIRQHPFAALCALRRWQHTQIAGWMGPGNVDPNSGSSRAGHQGRILGRTHRSRRRR